MSGDHKIVIVGAGVFGTAIAHHLAMLGETDVLLLDRYSFGDGTSWHAAGFVGQLRHRRSIMRLIADAADQYDAIERGNPQSLGWRGVGSLRLAQTRDRLDEFEEQARLAAAAGVSAAMLDSAELDQYAPGMNTEGLVGAVWIPRDGSIDPDRLASYYGHSARDQGVTVRTGVSVESIETRDGRVAAVVTSEGRVACEQLIIAAGYSSPLLAAQLGVHVPIAASVQRHASLAPLTDDRFELLPTIREPEESIYLRVADGKMGVGSVGPEADVRLASEAPVARRLLYPIDDAMDASLAHARFRFPALRDARVVQQIRGLEGLTPDGEMIWDQTPVTGAWICAGGNGHGIAAAGGVGRMVAERLVNDEDIVDTSDFSLSRFGSGYTERHALLRACALTEVNHYAKADVADE